MECNCMTMIVGKKASATGYVLVGHNEDDGGRVSVRHGYVPNMQHEKGTLLPAEEGRAHVPQAERTFGYSWTEVFSEDRGASASDLFFNENGVSIVSDNSCGSMEDGADEDVLTEGGVAYNLRRIAAERAVTARDGLAIMIGLLEKYGYALGGRLYIISDRDEAFVLQAVRGKHYVAGRVPDDAVVSLPNHYTFHSLHDWEEMTWSKDIVSYAVQKGWYAGNEKDFDFADVYQARDTFMQPFNTLRQKYALQSIQCANETPDDRTYFQKASHPITVKDMMRALSCHYEGSEHLPVNGVRQSPHYGIVTVCQGTTVESIVVQFADTTENTIQWTAYGAPCLLPYLPVHPMRGVVKAVDAMENPAEEMQRHLELTAGSCAHRDDNWQFISDFRNLAEHHYKDVIGEITAMNRAFLASCMRNPHGDTEKMAQDMLAMLRHFAKTHFTAKAEIVSRNAESITLRLTTDSPIDDETALFVFRGQNIETEGVKGTAQGNVFTFPLHCPNVHGVTEAFVSGILQNGKCFGAMVLIEL